MKRLKSHWNRTSCSVVIPPQIRKISWRNVCHYMVYGVLCCVLPFPSAETDIDPSSLLGLNLVYNSSRWKAWLTISSALTRC
ncbi:hypothetical protein K439DRAFT_1635330, partial [Ramaria rubella]